MRISVFPIALVLLSSLAAGQTPDPAAGLLKGLSLAELGNIEVTTVSKKPVKVSRTPAAVYVITQDDIHRSGVISLPEALRLAPGVEVAQIDSVKWAVGIRGFQGRLSRAVLVLIDGRSVYSPLFHGVYWEVQDVLLEDVDRIEVIRGPGGTIWGANAVDGVINIISKSAKETQGALVSTGGGSVEQGTLDMRYGGSGRGVNYRVYGKGFDHSPEFHPDNRRFDDSRKAQGGFRIDLDPTIRDGLTIQGDIYKGAAGESTRITSETPPSARIVDQNATLSGGNVLARWKRSLANGAGFELQTYYDRVNRLQASQAEYRDTFDIDFTNHLPLGKRNDFTWGLGARVSLGDVPAVVPTYVFTPSSRTDQLYTAFAQDEVALIPDRLSLTLGSKLLHTSFTGPELEPSARLLWTLDPNQSIWGAVTRAVRTPSDIEDTLVNTTLRSTTPLAFTRTQGDGTFTSETLISYEIGYRDLVTSNFSVDLATFYNRYNHLLSLEPGTPFSQTTPVVAEIYPVINGNGLKGSTAGFEIAPDWKPRNWWRLVGSWAYLNMNLKTTPGSRDTTTVASNEGSSPRHQVEIQSYFDLPGKIQFSQVWRFVSALRTQQVGLYNTFDVRFAWKASPHFELSVAGRNLLQPHHVEFNSDPDTLVGIKRSVYAAVTWRK